MTAEEKITFIKNTLRRLAEKRAQLIRYQRNPYATLAELSKSMGETLDAIEDAIWKE